MVDQATRFGVDVPLIERASQTRVEEALADAQARGATAARGHGGPDRGWFVAPAVVTGVALDAPIQHRSLELIVLVPVHAANGKSPSTPPTSA